jgi:hypothetical protein
MLTRFALRPVNVSRLARIGLSNGHTLSRAPAQLSVTDRRDNTASQRPYGTVSKAEAESRAIPVSQGILSAYGVYPLVGLGLAAAISKELLIVDPEFAYMCCIGSIMVGGYILKGDDVKQMLADNRAAELKSWSTMYEAQIAKYQTDIQRLEAFSRRPAMYAEYKAEYAEALSGLIVAQRMIAKEEMKNKVETKLREIIDQEAAAASNLYKAYKNRIVAYVRNYLTSADGQQEAFSEAMANIGKPAGQVKGDMNIIKKAVDRYVATGQADKDLQASAKALGL